MAPTRRGYKAPLSVAPAKAAASNDGEEKVGFIPADPEDARLTADGAVCDASGKIDISAYENIMPCWAAEPSPDKHPDPLHPGVRPGEEIPKGLRMWDDVRAGCTTKDGAGWIAVKTSVRLGKKEKWFNIRSCGSWRLAYLLAKLQRAVWERADHQLSVPSQMRAPIKEAGKDSLPPVEANATPTKRVKPPTDTPNKRAKISVAQAAPAKGSEPQIVAPLGQTATPGGKLSSVMDRIRARMAKKDEEGAAAAPMAAAA